MGKLKKKEVLHLAKLAKLKLSQVEIRKFQKQLSEIISYVEKLSEVDTSNIQPTSQTTGLINVFREDELDISQTLTIEKTLSGTDKSRNNYFVVPYVFEARSEKQETRSKTEE